MTPDQAILLYDAIFGCSQEFGQWRANGEKGRMAYALLFNTYPPEVHNGPNGIGCPAADPTSAQWELRKTVARNLHAWADALVEEEP